VETLRKRFGLRSPEVETLVKSLSFPREEALKSVLSTLPEQAPGKIEPAPYSGFGASLRQLVPLPSGAARQSSYFINEAEVLRLYWPSDLARAREARQAGRLYEARDEYTKLAASVKPDEIREAGNELKDIYRKIAGEMQAVIVAWIAEGLENGSLHVSDGREGWTFSKAELDSPGRSESLQQLIDRAPRAARIVIADANSQRIWEGLIAPKEAVVWETFHLGEASRSLGEMNRQIATPHDVAAVPLLPRNAKEQKLMGLNWKDPVRSEAWEAVEQTTRATGVRFERPVQMQEALAREASVVVFFAHGDRTRLKMPDGKNFSIEDAARLDLSRNRPVIFLVSCEGGKPGEPGEGGPSFAEAFKQRGARAVVAFEEKVDAREATGFVEDFFRELKRQEEGAAMRSRSLLDAIENAVRGWKGPKLRLIVKWTPLYDRFDS